MKKQKSSSYRSFITVNQRRLTATWFAPMNSSSTTAAAAEHVADVLCCAIG
jgi:hypothetical protein